MKTKRFWAHLLTLALVFLLVPTSRVFAASFSGSGTSDDPYLIGTYDELSELAESVNSGTSYEGSYITLTDNIDLEGSEENQWTAIGTQDKPFKGTFIGNGYKITGLYINNSSKSQGLFGCVGEGGTVTNLYVDGTVITTDCLVGGVVGENYGTVQNCHNTGNVTGKYYVGGVVGFNGKKGTVQNCHNTGNVTGTYTYIGGVVGYNTGTIQNCYNTGNVTGTNSHIGGVVGYSQGTTQYCYNTGSVSGISQVGGAVGYSGEAATFQSCYYLDTCAAEGTTFTCTKGTALTEDQMRDTAAFDGFDFETVWIMGKYPSLRREPTLTLDKYDLNGDEIKDNVYEIASPEELIWFADRVNNADNYLCAVLTADIDLDGFTWTPIGINYSDFKGIFDGQGHTISGMVFTTAQNGYGGHLEYNYQGLFGVLRENAVVRNFTVKGEITLYTDNSIYYVGGAVGLAYEGSTVYNVTSYVNITDGGVGYDANRVGGVVGQLGSSANSGTPGFADSCKYYGSITLSKGGKVGGIVGDAIKDSFVTNCTNHGMVGWDYIAHLAGIVGAAESGTTVKNCANYGAVTGGRGDCIGGVVGYANEYVTVTNCLNGGTVKAKKATTETTDVYLGGILGYQNNTNFNGITNCFNYGTVTATDGGTTFTGAIIGRSKHSTSAPRVKDNYYLNLSCSKAGGGYSGSNNTAVNYETMVSGAIAYKLQAYITDKEQVWGQKLPGYLYADHPSIGGAKVYSAVSCNGLTVYSNEEIQTEHTYVNGVCTYCGASEQLTKNSDGYYTIGSKADYIRFTQLVNTNGAQEALNAVLTADIDLSGYDYIPIGIDGNEFIGTFDGAGHKIKNLTLTADKSYMGMFGKVKNATVKGFTVSGEITAVLSNLGNIGGVFGLADATAVSDVISKIELKDNGKIEHVYRAGGIAAQARYGTSFRNCEYSGKITLHFGSHTTGIVGVTSDASKENPIIIENCVNKADMTFDISRRVAGIVGWNDTYTQISRCANYGNITIGVSDSINQAAGIVATNVSAITIESCANYGNITDGKFNSSLGGIVGFIDAYKSTEDFGGITNCFNYGTITNTNTNGSTYWGTLIGFIKNDDANASIISKITDNYYLENTSPTVSGTDGIALTATAVTKEDASNGTFAYALQNAQSTPIWGQTLVGDSKTPYPVLGGEKVYKVTFIVEDETYATLYGNASGVGTLPEKPSGVDTWVYGDEANRVEFTATTALSADTTVYSSVRELVITSVDELKAFRDAVNNGDSYEGWCILLQNDLDLEGSEENQWTAIGTLNNSFKGTFDGNGHAIVGLYINNGSDYQGLFGYVNNGGTVKNLGVDGTVSGKNYTGGLAGYSSGTIENCYNTGAVSGKEYVGGVAGNNPGTMKNCYNTGRVSGTTYVGGLNGANYINSTTDTCYNTGNVSGTTYVGGISGQNVTYSETNNCYNTGTVSGTSYVGGISGSNTGGATINTCYNMGSVSGKSNVGAIVGYNSKMTAGTGGIAITLKSEVKNCFYLRTCAAGNTRFTSTYGTSLTAEQMKSSSRFTGWDFTNTWGMGVFSPILKALPEKSTRNAPDVTITSVDELKTFRDAVGGGNSYEGKYLLLMNDLDLEGSEENQWTTIGNDSNKFQGTFDGNGHKITGLYINNDSDYQGLFGYVGSGSTVKNLGVVGTVEGANRVGGIIGQNEGTIENSYYTGPVKGRTWVGGLVGVANNGSTIENCYNTGDISGSAYVGGVVGCADVSSTVENCYNTGSVNSTGIYVGGVVGAIGSTSSVKNCYNIGTVSGTEKVGGITGINEGTVVYCYNIGTVSGTENVGGVVGYTYSSITNCYYLDTCAAAGTTFTNTYGTALTAEQMTDSTSFTDWDFTNTWVIKLDRPLLIHNLEAQKPKIVSVTKGTSPSVTLYLPEAGTYTVIFADYDGKRLNGTSLVSVTVTKSTTGKQTVTSTADISLDAGDMVMLWSDLNDMKPLCEAFVIE